MRLTRICFRAFGLVKTRLMWGWRFGSLGRRSVIRRCRFVRNPSAITIGRYTAIGAGWCMADLSSAGSTDKPKIRIGSYCNIQHDFQCNAHLSVEIQDYVLMAPRVFITDSDHIVDEAGERTTLCREFRSAPVVVEHDCWLGVNAVVLKGVTIGHHSIVGANSVVTRDVPPNSVVAGVPARVIKRESAEGLAVERQILPGALGHVRR